MIKTLLITGLFVSAGLSDAAILFSSDFDANTGAHVFTGKTDNTTGSTSVTITD